MIPLKNLDAQNFTTANFRHPVSKSWLRHCSEVMMMLMIMEVVAVVTIMMIMTTLFFMRRRASVRIIKFNVQIM